MRTRLDKTKRRADILAKAARLFALRGFAGTEMEDIRQACGISRGGLYHHFAGKRAVLDALVEAETAELLRVLAGTEGSPIVTLLQVGSGHLGNPPGVVAGLKLETERLDYLSSLDQAMATQLSPVLTDLMRDHVRPGTDPAHVTELFLTVNAQINRRVLLGQWGRAQAMAFAATALEALAPLLRDPEILTPLIEQFRHGASP